MDLLAERRLRDPETLGGAPEMQFLGDGDEIAEVPKLHPSALKTCETSCSYGDLQTVPNEHIDRKKTPPGTVGAWRGLSKICWRVRRLFDQDPTGLPARMARRPAV